MITQFPSFGSTRADCSKSTPPKTSASVIVTFLIVLSKSARPFREAPAPTGNYSQLHLNSTNGARPTPSNGPRPTTGGALRLLLCGQLLNRSAELTHVVQLHSDVGAALF